MASLKTPSGTGVACSDVSLGPSPMKWGQLKIDAPVINATPILPIVNHGNGRQVTRHCDCDGSTIGGAEKDGRSAKKHVGFVAATCGNDNDTRPSKRVASKMGSSSGLRRTNLAANKSFGTSTSSSSGLSLSLRRDPVHAGGFGGGLSSIASSSLGFGSSLRRGNAATEHSIPNHARFGCDPSMVEFGSSSFTSGFARSGEGFSDSFDLSSVLGTTGSGERAIDESRHSGGCISNQGLQSRSSPSLLASDAFSASANNKSLVGTSSDHDGRFGNLGLASIDSDRFIGLRTSSPSQSLTILANLSDFNSAPSKLRGPHKSVSAKGILKENRRRAREIAEVRALTEDEPLALDGSPRVPQTSFGAIVRRLSSRAARDEARRAEPLLQMYQAVPVSLHCKGGGGEADKTINALVKGAKDHVDQLSKQAEITQQEVRRLAEEKLRYERKPFQRTSDAEMQALDLGEKAHRILAEDKLEEEMLVKKEALNQDHKVAQRQLQLELSELRDFKALLREFHCVKFDKLIEIMAAVTDGKMLRQCVREMVRNECPHQIVRQLEHSGQPLEPWMRDVLVNSCHIENQMRDQEAKLLKLRQEAVRDMDSNLEVRFRKTEQERFWHLVDESHAELSRGLSRSLWSREGEAIEKRLESPTTEEDLSKNKHASQVGAEMEAVQAELDSLRRLKSDLRNNVAAVVCNRMRQSNRQNAGGRKAAADWGHSVLSILVSVDFAKQTMKEVREPP
eukprot:TRINITY_DN25303_c0_g1_i1.p1 TRINITY_DN25303_c0_g1~~TRINITY_DN25303_c0_g1_i1.p1  ORF type:complete len:736 (+),score=119.60 TRINITY_DN25303_c0_g1_i1:188-2395(+)